MASNQLQYNTWKGKTFYQLSSVLQLTKDTNTITTGSILFKARPIKHAYRKEIAVNTTARGNSRISYSIDEINSPNGFLIYDDQTDPAISSCQGSLGYTDDFIPNNASVLGKSCTVCNIPTECVSTSTSSSNTCFSAQLDARRRTRSSGMITRKFDPNRNNDSTYFTNNKQYLVSRNRSIQQNSYNFIRQGDSSVEPGTALSKTNIYSPQGLSHCKQVNISAVANNNTFTYVWLDGNTFTVVIPNGSYDINSFNQAFNLAMINNTHYYVDKTNLSKSFLLVFTYNTLYGRVQLQTIANTAFPLSNYDKGGVWSITQAVPQFVFLSNSLPSLLGITAITFPLNSGFTTTQVLVAPSVGQLVPPYVQLFYKPSNPQFACQGGVSSSTLLARKKYDAITNNGFSNRQAYGSAVANALAYSVMIPGYNAYTLKDRIGYPNKLIPKINPITGGLSKCTPKRFSNL
jgi:hypothetical protein